MERPIVLSLFISYCRREAPFVDSFLQELEKYEFNVWLDYRTLIPGQPWQEQIYQGLMNTEVVLLVVSQEAIGSKNVEWEWQQAIALQKRIILVIFEAVELPPELHKYEWIDLRGKFKPGIKALVRQLATPLPPKAAPPQTGSKLPPNVIAAISVSVIVSLTSLITWWTIYLPYYLLPLPYRIFKRDFNFFHVRNALFMLPFALFWTIVLVVDESSVGGVLANVAATAFLLALLFAPILLLLLYLPGMQRWGKPIASRPKFANPYQTNIQRPTPTRFTIDFAPQDKTYADAIIRCLTRYEHTYLDKDTDADAVQSADAVLVLISSFKGTTTFRPEECMVYPILLQDPKTIDPDLQRIQWIDFRRGLKNLDQLAKLLPQPDNLLKALGIVPPSNQTVLPLIVQVILSYLTILALMVVGILLILLLKIGREIPMGEFIFISSVLAIALVIIFLALQSLTIRRGFLASMPRLGGALLVLGIILIIPMGFAEQLTQSYFAGVAYASCVATYVLGLFLVAPLGVWHFKALRQWFPYQLGRR